MEQWLQNAGLSLAPQKTEAVHVSSHQVLETATIQVGGMAITSQRVIKYLGVMIDAWLSFCEQQGYIQGKVVALTRGLGRILLSIRGARQNRRSLLVSVASAQILYSAPIWAEAMNTSSYRKGVDEAYRLGAIRLASAFKTVCSNVILVIAAMAPLEERARDFKKLNETHARYMGAAGALDITTKEEAKERSLKAWQECWNISTKGRWTYTLSLNLRKWVLQSHKQIDIYLTQVLSGHDWFRQYL
ncbi:uncharacterized protein [Drosophila bipectinata]|uniref:uncharacterized protein n=1 Tax=Drosophila bipectinata TaxID=42026 RepID=UPI0038B306A7